jgi:hypothetical protein
MIALVGSVSSLCSKSARLCRSDTGSSPTINSLPILNGCTSKSGLQKVLVKDVRLVGVRRVMQQVIAKILTD